MHSDIDQQSSGGRTKTQLSETKDSIVFGCAFKNNKNIGKIWNQIGVSDYCNQSLRKRIQNSPHYVVLYQHKKEKIKII